MIGTALKNALRSSPLGRWSYATIRGAYRDFRYARVDGRTIFDRYDRDIPRSVKIELSNICNADCIFCGYQYETRAKGVMSKELFERVVHEYRAMGGKSVSFTPVVGEPLVDPTFVDRVARVCEMGYQSVTTYTNGVLLENHDLPRFVSLGVTGLHVSMASFDEAEYERIFRNKHYAKLLRGLRTLLELNGQLQRPIPIRLELRSELPFNQILRQRDYIEQIAPLLGEHTKLAYLFDYDNWGGMIQQSDLRGVMQLAHVPKHKKSPCFRTYSCMVMWNGAVRACSCRFSFKDKTDGLLIGQLGDRTLADIWNGSSVKRLRQSFLDGSIPGVCKSCAWYVPGDHGRDHTYLFA